MSLVTLTTDFGTGDGYVGAMKGVILSRAPAAQIVDIAHDIERHDIAAGAYCLVQAAPHFPGGTIHVAVVDPGVGTLRKPVIVDDGRHLYVGPDNGLFALVAPAPKAVYAIEAAAFRLPTVSSTFHGRDVFAAAAAALASGVPAAQAGPQVELRGRLLLGEASAARAHSTDMRIARVIYVDHFGNLITDTTPEDLPPSPRFRIGERVIDGLSTTFGDVAAGELLAYIGSGNTLEIAVREERAARILGLGRGAQIEILSS